MNVVHEAMTAAEYLVWEREQKEKHEYHCGKIVPFGSRWPRHNALSAAIAAGLGAAFRKKSGCVFGSNQRVSASRGAWYVYPDAVAVCGGLRLEAGTTDVLVNPMVIVEVLSASTEKFDRGDKWQAYQRVDSLKDYVLVAQSTPRIEHFQRQSDGSWRYMLVEAGGSIELSNGARLSVDDIYVGVFEVPGDPSS